MTLDADDDELSERPSARADLEVNEAPDGLVIYDGQTGQVHYLNPSASAVFALCTGANDAAAIVQAMQAAFGLAEPPTAEVAEALEDLSQQRLIH